MRRLLFPPRFAVGGIALGAWLWLIALVGPMGAATGAQPKHALVADATTKAITLPAGATEALCEFQLRNVSKAPVIVARVFMSCDCMTADLPSQPWVIAAGTTGELKIRVDVRGKSGALLKTATLDTPDGLLTLTLQITIPEDTTAEGKKRNT